MVKKRKRMQHILDRGQGQNTRQGTGEGGFTQLLADISVLGNVNSK